MGTDNLQNRNGGYTYEYPRPALTADCVIFGFDGRGLKILLIERGVEPYKGYWALPGGFMKMEETIEECAIRELREETGVTDIYLEQFCCFSSVGRDPRGRVVTVAFIALVRPADYQVVGGDDARAAEWFDADMLPPLAFDHTDIIEAARIRLREILTLRPAAFYLLDEIFTVDELRRVYEVINGITYDRRNFHRKLMQSHLVEDADSPSPLMASANTASCESSIAAPRGRKPKFFRLSKRRNRDTDSDIEEGSIKDLFTF